MKCWATMCIDQKHEEHRTGDDLADEGGDAARARAGRST